MWCALDAVDEENGSLSYLPASHAAGLRDHHASWVKGFSQSIKDFTPEDSGAMVEVADLQPGDLVAHHSECIHSARENTSPPERRRTRWAFASVFKRVECVLDEEGHPPASIFDFVQGITALARARPHQDARLDLEARAAKLLAAAH